MDLPRSSPARLTALATIKLPRWGLALMCLVYILPGLFWRDPWKAEDAAGFGVMWTMARGTLHDWLIPNISGLPVYDSGPLAYWLGALSIRLSDWIAPGFTSAPVAARLADIPWLLLTASVLWYSTYLLGRRPAAQPLALAFGGQPEARDYGRTLADGALLILLATLGLIEPAHRSSADVGTLAMSSVVLYALARSLDRPFSGAIALAFGVAGVALTRGPFPAAALLLVAIALVAAHPDWRRSRVPLLVVGMPLLAALLAAWPLAVNYFDPAEARQYFATRQHFWISYADGIDADGLRHYLRTVPWFTLPGWPIAAWAVWSWRRNLLNAHVVLPLGCLAASVATLGVTSDPSDGLLLTLLPGLVMLAAVGLPTLKRGAANALDWFSLLIYSLIALALWGSWLTRLIGVPAAYASSMQRLVPGLPGSFHADATIVAIVASLGWLWLVYWRVVKHPKVLWRSVVLASGGAMLCWVLLMTLWLPEIDFSRSYRELALQLQGALPPEARAHQACIASDGLGPGHRASFAYFSDVRFAPVDFEGHETESCQFLLREDQTRDLERGDLRGGRWQLVWEGRRAVDRDERTRLYRRTRDKADEHPSVRSVQ